MSAPAVAGAASGSPHSVQPGDGESAAVVLSPNTEEEAEALIEGFQDAAVTAPQVRPFTTARVAGFQRS